ncbi:SITS-binding protein isoform X1 [Pundamilia nyererei]|uniref:SITS-binding protein-like n=1 Tax=Pundamilia nyererei TaxID=303518 RepID=A0A3B4GEG7_9CICH|nr:PREDICTED: SITS-binding protein-like isoform X1 [Pundamilia nyererei]XP_039881167.1 SITS-binding protein [Simochromis diagramma]XP_039881168.1 SITS-binding protein [Simochromis diagramma]XP_039881169.1 SITS-binding protein [Simochromis diagramma]
MPHARNRNPSPIPEVTWDTGLKEMNETWKGAIACLGVAVFFVMTIGIIYWQVVDQPNKNWILRGTFSGLIWERKTHSLLIQTLTEDKTYVEIDVGNVGNPDIEIPFVRNLCWLNKTEFCYTWDSVAEVKISLEANEDTETECYSMTWAPVHCHVELKDCFSMANISWYGGASVRGQTWPINDQNATMQPFIVSDLKDNPSGFGSALERYFLGSSGVAVLVSPDIPLQLGLDSRQQFCLQSLPSMERLPLQYTVCVAHNVKAAHQEAVQQLSEHSRELPNMKALRLPFWKLLANMDSGPKVEREMRTFSNRLKRHQLGEGVISLNEHSTTLLSDMDHDYLNSRKRGMSKRLTRDLPLVKLLNISITMSPFLGVDTTQFHTSLIDGTEAYWLSLPSAPQGQLIPVMSQWRGKFCVKLNITNPGAVSWFLDRVGALQTHLGMEYIMLEGGEGNLFEEQALRPPQALGGDKYISLLADLATRIGDSTIMTAGTRSSYKPLFVRMTPLQSDWSPMGLKAIIPNLLHHTLLGYNFLIPDAVGGSLSGDLVTDEELFIRWLEIAAFLPVMSFHTPPWIFGEGQVLNLTRNYLTRHQRDVAPLIEKYAEEWQVTGNPIYRPMWWLNPTDSMTFTINDQFLIGDEVLVAPVVEKGAVQRDIYLPDGGFQWQDSQNARVFDGGTFLHDYPVPLTEVAVFLRRS